MGRVKFQYQLNGKRRVMVVSCLYRSMPRVLDGIETLLCSLEKKQIAGKRCSVRDMKLFYSLPEKVRGKFIESGLMPINQLVFNRRRGFYAYIRSLAKRLNEGEKFTQEDIAEFVLFVRTMDDKVLREIVDDVPADIFDNETSNF